ncbi:MAG TPA: NAD(P)H-binding protein [Herpetosiphonaceae bacterium]|nr:NAD(P)H-binding protein [Herpetosiphonaceae bacterium]
MSSENTVLVVGGSGKTGRRIIERLRAREVPVRSASRSTEPAFDWETRATWPAALKGVRTAYIAFQPDLAVPGAVATIQAFADLAVASGVRRLVLLSGRGEPEAQQCERIVQASGAEWTILRASWFFQNFSENFLLDAIRSGTVYLPAGDIPEPFIDADDIADVAVAALTEDGHAGQVYELSGPRLLTFGAAVAEIAAASGRQIGYVQVPIDDYAGALEAEGLPPEMLWLMRYLFTTVLDGRNASLADGVQRALGRPARDFAAYVGETAASGVWNG